MRKNVYCISMFKQRVIDNYRQEWHEAIGVSNKLSTYCTFKTTLEPERYLSCITDRKYITALAKFRCSNHNLNIESGRHCGIDITERICGYCSLSNVHEIEDEYHFLCKCPLLNDLRSELIPFLLNCSYYDFTKAMSSSQTKNLISIAKFIFFAMIFRKNYLQGISNQ